MLKDAFGFAAIVAAVVALWAVTPAHAQEYYTPPPAIEYGNESYNQGYDGAAEAGRAAADAAVQASHDGCMMSAHSSYEAERC